MNLLDVWPQRYIDSDDNKCGETYSHINDIIWTVGSQGVEPNTGSCQPVDDRHRLDYGLCFDKKDPYLFHEVDDGSGGLSRARIDREYVNKNLGNLVKDTDLSKFIL